MRLLQIHLLIGVVLVFTVFSANVQRLQAGEAKSPEQIVASYFAAFNDTTFASSTEYLHPELLAKFKQNIGEAILSSDENGKKILLQECGVTTLEEFNNLSDKEFYIKRLQTYWNLDSQEKLDRYKEMMERITYTVTGSEPLDNGNYQVNANSAITFGSSSTVKEHVYTLRKLDSTWKIWEISIDE